MKKYILVIFIFLSCDLSFAQKADKEIEALKTGLLGSWRDSDTAAFWKIGYHFSSRKMTISVYCPDHTVVKTTMKYSVEKRRDDEQNKDIIVLALPSKRKKVASHDCDLCREKTLDHICFWDWTNIVIANNQLSFCLYTGKECYRLTKE